MASQLSLKKDPTLKDLQDYVRQMVKERGFAEHSVEQKFVKLLEELGEFAQASTKAAGLTVTKDRSHKIAEEAADVLLVFLDICEKLQIDLEQAFRAKEEQNKKRMWK